MDRGAKHFQRVRQCGRRDARIDLDPLDEPVFSIQAKHVEFFDREPRHNRLQIYRHEFGAVQQRCLAGLLPQDTARYLHDSHELQCLHAADALEFFEIRRASPDQSGE